MTVRRPERGDATLSRRTFLAGSAAVVSFAIAPRQLFAQGQNQAAGNPTPAAAPIGDLKTFPYLDSWLGIDESGRVTVFSGKAELGQGIMTALMQCAAEQLAVDPATVAMVMASTTQTVNEGYTAGSDSMNASGNAILNAASQLRQILLGWAAAELHADPSQLTVAEGVLTAPGGQRRGYGELVRGRSLHIEASGPANLIPPSEYKVIGRAYPRLDIPPKLTGAPVFVQDMRPDRMVHARVVRPPNYGATLISVDTSTVQALPGVVTVVHEGDYLAVVAKGEYQAIIAMRALQQAARWSVPKALPDKAGIYAALKTMPADAQVIAHRGTGGIQPGSRLLQAAYRRPYVMHGAIGPSCAVALFEGGHTTVWTHSQGVYPLRASIANMLSVPEEAVDCIQVQGSGCYGHNGADDAAADAALIAQAIPGRPVRVQWMREDEHGWEPYGSPMIAEVKASLGADGMIDGWDYELWSMTYMTRPAKSANNLMPAWYIPAHFGPPQGAEIPLPSGGGDRNAIPGYTLPNGQVLYHYVKSMPLRVSALRSLGGYFNVFAVESFMDELASAAKTDPVAFRLRHLTDQRAKAVVQLAAEKFGWGSAERLPPGHGRGFAYVRYETVKAYCALAVEVSVDRATGQIRLLRAVAAVDSGNAVNPTGIKTQIQGCIVQAASWTLYESVDYSKTEITSRDWSSYPILRFDAVPESVEVHVINRPHEPFLGTGEAGMGPTPAAIANAVADATGLRLRELPLSPERVTRAMLG